MRITGLPSEVRSDEPGVCPKAQGARDRLCGAPQVLRKKMPWICRCHRNSRGPIGINPDGSEFGESARTSSRTHQRSDPSSAESISLATGEVADYYDVRISPDGK